MNLIETRAAELRAAFIANAEEFGFSKEEIDAAAGDDDGEDYFLLEAENEARKALAASRIHNRRAIRAAMPRQPATRRAPRRAAQKKASGSDGDGDGGGAGPWSYQALDFFAIQALSALSPTLRGRGWAEWKRYKGPTFLSPIPRIAVSELWRGEGRGRSVTLSWADAETGRNGEGVSALIAHVERISLQDAADRLAVFAANALAADGDRVCVNDALERFRAGYVPSWKRRVA